MYKISIDLKSKHAGIPHLSILMNILTVCVEF